MQSISGRIDESDENCATSEDEHEMGEHRSQRDGDVLETQETAAVEEATEVPTDMDVHEPLDEGK